LSSITQTSHAVYIRPFPGPGGTTPVSVSGGYQPRWSPKGGELFYWQGRSLIAVPVETAGTLRIGTPKLLFTAEERSGYAVAPDGQRFLMSKPETDTAPPPESPVQIVVVLNWAQEMKQALDGNK
jgi:hypothetical protein